MIGSVIGTLAPAALAMRTKIRRRESEKIRAEEMGMLLLQYGMEILKNVFLTAATITYILKIEDVNFTALSSFPFFTKYVVIALAYAWILPYLEEMIVKYIGISFKIEVEENAKEKMP